MTSTFQNNSKIGQVFSENIDDLIFILNNKYLCEYTNFQYFTGKVKINKFILPEDFKRVIKYIKNIFKLGYGIEEARIKHNSEPFKWYEIKGRRFIDKEDNKMKVLLLCRDITRFKNIEFEFKKSQVRIGEITDSLPEIRYWKLLQSKDGITTVQKTREMLDLVIDNIPQLIYWKDTNLIYLGCNKNFAILNGFEDPSNIIGKTDNELNWFLTKLEYIQNCERDVMQNNKPEYNVTESLVTAEGNQVWFEINRIPLHNEKGKVVGILTTYEDITIRNTSEQKLRESQEELKKLNRELEQKVLERSKNLVESEQQYRTTIDSLNDPLHVVDKDLKIILVNKEFKKWLKELNIEADIFGKVIFEAFPFLQKQIYEEYKRVFDTGIPLITMESTPLPDRNVITETRKIPIFSEGKVKQVITIIRDITESKEMQDHLKESEEKFRVITEQSFIGVVIEQGFDIKYGNQQFSTILGYSTEEFSNWTLTDFYKIFHPDDLDKLKEFVEKKTKGLIDDIPNFQCRMFKKNGEVVWLELLSRAIMYQDKPANLVFIMDITEEREAEQKLKESEEKYRNVVNNLDVGFYKGEYQGKLLMHNQALNRIIGLNPDESLVGIESSQVFINPETRKKFYKELEEKGYVRNFLAQIRKKTGEIITVDMNAHVLYNSEELPIEVEGTVADITEKFKLQQDLLESEKKLRQQNIELRKLDKIKNDFITMAAHELKTPLISISGYTDYILMKHRSNLSPEITKDLLTVERNVSRLEILMDQLLDVLKIDENELKLQRELKNITKIINDCLDELSYLINEKNLEIVLNIEHEIMLDVDPTRIFAVFTNLLSNAIKFTPDYGWIEISAKKDNNQYIFEVKDNGIGLAEDEMGRLFKKFERIKPPILNENINIKDSGTGLGLYITKGIIGAHGGKIWATSEGENKGSTFYFTLPI